MTDKACPKRSMLAEVRSGERRLIWPLNRVWLVVGVAAVLLALAFQGSRDLAEPDEGFYSNVAIGMVDSGDWWVPHLNQDVFLDKPPALYWATALGVVLFGPTEWAARLPLALWFLATAVVVGLIGAELWGRRFGPSAALGYALTLMPFVAGNILTPDTPLCFFETLAALAYWKWAHSPLARQRWGWCLLLGASLGLGALAKGPAVLLVVPVFAVHLLWTRGWKSALRAELLLAAATTVAIAASWYLSVGLSIKGAFGYWFDSQVAGRLWSGEYGRHAYWWGGLKVYLPVLLLGTLPWTPLLIARSAKWLNRWRRSGESGLDDRRLFLLLWFALPLAVFLVARSRLALYVLPVLPPLVLAAVHWAWPQGFVRTPPRLRVILVTLWIAALVSLKLGGALFLPAALDAKVVARHLVSGDVSSDTPILVVDGKLNALRFLGFTEVTNARQREKDYPYFVHLPVAETVIRSAGGRGRTVVVAPPKTLEILDEVLSQSGFSCVEMPGDPAFGLRDCRSEEQRVDSAASGVERVASWHGG